MDGSVNACNFVETVLHINMERTMRSNWDRLMLQVSRVRV